MTFLRFRPTPSAERADQAKHEFPDGAPACYRLWRAVQDERSLAGLATPTCGRCGRSWPQPDCDLTIGDVVARNPT